MSILGEVLMFYYYYKKKIKVLCSKIQKAPISTLLTRNKDLDAPHFHK
jgi:hypothetical protein